ncbi:carboxymuconolactone decarboxylase family protein [Frankia sp. AgB32]|uniref:carboxymuconolactone decarboxylase family protein n=1 Tax=Frankia sp. AgB32 TaxID=631119 RepID=UPI0034D5D66B
MYDAFGALRDAALADGARDGRTKDLIALALAVHSQCEDCMAAHARAAVRHGVSARRRRRPSGWRS